MSEAHSISEEGGGHRGCVDSGCAGGTFWTQVDV